MIARIIEAYKQYDLRYDTVDKMLVSYTPMLVKDLIKIKSIIKKYRLNISEIRIIER